jgi:hypothetical protein
LLEIHPDRVVEDVELLVGLEVLVIAAVVIALLVLVAVHFGGVDDVELHVAEALHDGLDIIGIDEVVGENVVDVVEGQVVLFLGEFDEFADLLLDFRRVDAALVGIGLGRLRLGRRLGLGLCAGFGSWLDLGLGRGFGISLGGRLCRRGCLGGCSLGRGLRWFFVLRS